SMPAAPTTSPSRLIRLAGLAALVCAVSPVTTVRGATINAASVAFSDVSAAVNSAVDGDTVVLPAGMASWTSPLPVNKGITLQGAVIDKTIIGDDVVGGSNNLSQGVIAFQGAAMSRLTGVTIQLGSQTTLYYSGAV